jgi:uncharacterized protein YbcI
MTDSMEAHGNHPQDSAGGHQPRGSEGSLRKEISNAMVGLYKSYFGKGPVRCRTYLDPDLIAVVLGGGYTAGEQTLFEAGRWHEVRSARQFWQDSMEERFVTAIEELSGRKVAAFMSANRQDPDFAVELFVLVPAPVAEAARP